MSGKRRKRRAFGRRRQRSGRRALVQMVTAHPYCYWCGVRVTMERASPTEPLPTTATADHWWPYQHRKGRTPEEMKRVVLACFSCNNARGGMHPDVWRALLFGDAYVADAAAQGSLFG